VRSAPCRDKVVKLLEKRQRETPYIIIEPAFKEAWRLFAAYAERGLSFTDCTSIALIKPGEIDGIMSFDGLVSRIC